MPQEKNAGTRTAPATPVPFFGLESDRAPEGMTAGAKPALVFKIDITL